MHDDNGFWSEYEEQHDHEYFKEHQDDYSCGGKSQNHPLYWVIVFLLIFIAAKISDNVLLPFFVVLLGFVGEQCI